MYLYLLRHGDAVANLDDSSRELSSIGEQEITRIGNFLAKLDHKIDSGIMCSPKLRALQTAKIIQNTACPNAQITEEELLLPGSSPEEFVDYLQALSETTLVASHLPFLSLLCSLLITNCNINYANISIPTGTLMCLEKISVSNWELNWMVTPDLLAAVP